MQIFAGEKGKFSIETAINTFLEEYNLKREHSATKCIPIVLFHSQSIQLKQEVNKRLQKK